MQSLYPFKFMKFFIYLYIYILYSLEVTAFTDIGLGLQNCQKGTFQGFLRKLANNYWQRKDKNAPILTHTYSEILSKFLSIYNHNYHSHEHDVT